MHNDEMVISSNINCIKYMCLSLYMYACHPFKDCRQWRHYSDIWYFCIEMYFAYASCNNKYTVKLVLNMFFIGWETKQHLRAFECQTENQENMSLHIPFIYGNLTLIRESWKKSKTRDRHRARFSGKLCHFISLVPNKLCFRIFSRKCARLRSKKIPVKGSSYQK